MTHTLTQEEMTQAMNGGLQAPMFKRIDGKPYIAQVGAFEKNGECFTEIRWYVARHKNFYKALKALNK